MIRASGRCAAVKGERRGMASRRQVLKQALASSMTLAGAPLTAIAQDNSRRIALVIGNERYLQNPLGNAANDARAMAELLTKAGFAVDMKVDATLAQMTSAIDALGKTITGRVVDTSLFYYAGHAAQLEWHNYLLPVD